MKCDQLHCDLPKQTKSLIAPFGVSHGRGILKKITIKVFLFWFSPLQGKTGALHHFGYLGTENGSFLKVILCLCLVQFDKGVKINAEHFNLYS